MIDILDRLNRHAAEHAHSESEADEPGNLVHDLRAACQVIDRLRAVLRDVRQDIDDFEDATNATLVKIDAALAIT